MDPRQTHCLPQSDRRSGQIRECLQKVAYRRGCSRTRPVAAPPSVTTPASGAFPSPRAPIRSDGCATDPERPRQQGGSPKRPPSCILSSPPPQLEESAAPFFVCPLKPKCIPRRHEVDRSARRILP